MILAALAMLIAAPAAMAAPATQTWIGQPAGSTPDLEQAGLQIFLANGSPAPVGNVAGTINVALNGVPQVTFCIDTTRSFSTSTEPVEVTTFNPPATADDRAATWIMLNRTPTGAATPAKSTQAATSQVAIWILRGQASATAPTNDATLNAAALALVAEARAATASAASLTLTASVPAAGSTTSTLTVTGRPGATVALAVSSGPGTLGSSLLTIGPAGTASTTLTAAAVGTVSVSAATAGDGSFVTVVPTNPVRELQPIAYAQPNVLNASASVSFQTAPVTPVTPVGPAGTVTPTLRIVKIGPASAKVLSKIGYTITVRNPSKTAAKNVVLTDKIPSGLSFVQSSLKGTLKNGTLTFNLGTIGAGKSKSVTVVLMANASVKGTRTNVATVSATQVAARKASASTLFRAIAKRVQPAVTG